jgi:hypothetical protein
MSATPASGGSWRDARQKGWPGDRDADQPDRRAGRPEGRRSIEIDGWRFEINAPTERQIDVPELQDVLSDLVAEGTISQAKADRVIVWEPKVVWSELKPLTTDPRCQARVNHTITDVPAARYGKAKRHG